MGDYKRVKSLLQGKITNYLDLCVQYYNALCLKSKDEICNTDFFIEDFHKAYDTDYQETYYIMCFKQSDGEEFSAGVFPDSGMEVNIVDATFKDGTNNYTASLENDNKHNGTDVYRVTKNDCESTYIIEAKNLTKQCSESERLCL